MLQRKLNFNFCILGIIAGLISNGQTISTPLFNIKLENKSENLWTYTLHGQITTLKIGCPSFQIDGKVIKAYGNKYISSEELILSNHVHEKYFTCQLGADSSISLVTTFRWADDNSIVRFNYKLVSKAVHFLTKINDRYSLTYLSSRFPKGSHLKEIQLSNFNEKNHANNLTENTLNEHIYRGEYSVAGPILISTTNSSSSVIAYEHGSQIPDRFLEYFIKKGMSVSLRAVKGNYVNNQPLNSDHPYTSIWFELGSVNGSEEKLASQYRKFMLKYISQNLESRKPYIFYNTWGRQERTKWSGGTYLSSMNLETTLKEIEVAHQMGIEVYVLDAGWFLKTGDWMVNTRLFPDTLKEIKNLLDKYGMKLGLWFNPLVAAVSSQMLEKNRSNIMTWNGQQDDPEEIWETEPSVKLSLVSLYWNDFANKLISLYHDLGVTYFKLDAIAQYGSDDSTHFNGGPSNNSVERSDNYAFQLPNYLSQIVDKVCKTCPECIFDFDITESGRSVGLEFLSSGKYFIMNNGPYYDNYDIGGIKHTPLQNGNINIFVNPGPARGWITRSVLTFDKWIPSILFLTHYQPDEPKNSQLINVASLILGQNGIWGEILKVSHEGVEMIGEILNKYKMVRIDILNSDPVISGNPGSNPEIYEKINSANGKGAVVIFANSPGSYIYNTVNTIDANCWHTKDVTVSIDGKGRASIHAYFKESSAKIIFFGVSPQIESRANLNK